MARPLRIEYEGAVYHVMACGNGGDDLFRDDEGRWEFRILGQLRICAQQNKSICTNSDLTPFPGAITAAMQHLFNAEGWLNKLLGRGQDGCNQALVDLGNRVARGAEQAADASGKLILVGMAVSVAGVVTAQPEIAAPGMATVAAGGAVGVGAGLGQISSGVLQGMGGAGWDNAVNGVMTLGSSALLGRVVSGSKPTGYRTVSQRRSDRFISNTTTVTGGAWDIAINAISSLGPQQRHCR